MTVAVFDNKATAKKRYETYAIDREMYKSVFEVIQLVMDCMAEQVWKIEVYENVETENDLTAENRIFRAYNNG